MCGDVCLHDEGRYLVPVRQHNDVVASSFESPEFRIGGVLNVEVFQIDGVLVRECLENSLKQAPVLVAMDPLLEDSRLYFFELETRVWMESEPMPILSVDYQIADEESFSRASQVQYTNNFVDVRGDLWIYRAFPQTQR